MRKLALDDEILLKVEKPARYIGGEVNAVVKDPSKVSIRFAMCFPDVYEIGMSHLGIQILYDMLNRREDVYCERLYSPWTDLDALMREEGIPLFALESQDPVKDFDFIGITLQYEMCYTNVLQILDLAQIPIFSKDRAEDDPILIGGGPCAYNPEPLADFFDIFYIGEGEAVYDDLLDLYKACRENGWDRSAFLKQAANIPGLYVPMFYHVTYHEDGTIASFKAEEGVPERIEKQVIMNLSETCYPSDPVVPFIKVTQDRVVLEIQRGCIRGCRFCQAGMIYRPNRERKLEYLEEQAHKMLRSTGHEEITLSSLSSSDYSRLEELTNYLIDTFGGKEHINISLPSLRIDAFSLDVMRKVQDIRKSSLTFAPEAGTQRMRDVINKGLTEKEIFKGAMDAFKGGWNRVKLYFMLGLPGETEEDIEGIARLSNDIAALYYSLPKDERPGNGRVDVISSTSFFIPKPFTPFQWVPQNTSEQFIEKQHFLSGKMKEQLNRKSMKYNWHDVNVTHLEGILARGDRRLSKVIYTAYKKGCIYDAWTEHFKYDQWMEAFRESGVEPDFYTSRERSREEILPWDFIYAGVTKDFLWREYMRAKEGVTTPNCKEGCSGCGSRAYEGGVCFESKNQI
ncbi:MAG TPA: TIGR03960 family B12-binding radical SAM protein [Candidatus Onthocola gallistercoris]|uniref:TIGR03960 family B12-binding radical SAM protein n=1 Tax=Candidatus Onthocola gallistercoris TaxID=2840876 RepID=A0A9D1HGL5_9FIRM|nr:TIGR03960 family B12-binding radical SAM protein [Candidatus Onthocola gallistercoris]